MCDKEKAWFFFNFLPVSNYIFLCSSLKLCLFCAYILKNFSLYMSIKALLIKKSKCNLWSPCNILTLFVANFFHHYSTSIYVGTFRKIIWAAVFTLNIFLLWNCWFGGSSLWTFSSLDLPKNKLSLTRL